jgi:hydroxymethylpyrimidine/phosphomethylpyrimidine kinase
VNAPFADRLWHADADLADACLRHPFVRGLADGSLSPARYRAYVAQDAFFLRAFHRAYALAGRSSPDAAGRTLYAELAAGVEVELDLHRAMAQRLGIDLQQTEPTAATLAYTDFLLATAAAGPEAAAAAAMLPCLRLYAFLGERLLPQLDPASPWADWVRTYADPSFASLWQKLATRVVPTEGADAAALGRCHRRAMQLELQFFAAAWGGLAPGRPPIALSVAGSDPSGGAGIQADLKTFHRFGVYGQAVLTLLTAQNTRGVTAVQLVDTGLVQAQLDSVFGDLGAGAVKTGALGSAAIVEVVAAAFAAHAAGPLVVDPVLVSKHGHDLADGSVVQAMRRELLPRARLVTPNRFEAERLTGIVVGDRASAERAALRLLGDGVQAVLVKDVPGLGGDLLVDGGQVVVFQSPRIETRHRHGTGCTFSAAITALLARGEGLGAAVEAAVDFVGRAIASAPGLGATGPVNHWA